MAGEKDEIVPRMQEMRNVYKIIFAKLKGFINLVQDNIKFMLREGNRTKWEEWIKLVQDWIECQSFLNIPMNFQVHKNWKFFKCLRKRWILTKLSVIWSYYFMYLVLFCIWSQTRMFNLPKTEILSDVGTVTSLAMAPPIRRIKMQAFIVVTKRCLVYRESDLWWRINMPLWLIYMIQPVSLIMPNGQVINIERQARNWWQCGHFKSLNKPHDIIQGIILFLTFQVQKNNSLIAKFTKDL